MNKVKNILFIMADQLRWDHLSCYGHPHLHTPNIEGLAEKGVRFDRAYVQSPVCGPSRTSCYTGRTVFSHGSTWNRVPLPLGELTLGDYLSPAGITTAVVGKTHMVPDADGTARFGLNPATDIGIKVGHAGFDPYERDDGLHPTPHMIFVWLLLAAMILVNIQVVAWATVAIALIIVFVHMRQHRSGNMLAAGG